MMARSTLSDVFPQWAIPQACQTRRISSQPRWKGGDTHLVGDRLERNLAHTEREQEPKRAERDEHQPDGAERLREGGAHFGA